VSQPIPEREAAIRKQVTAKMRRRMLLVVNAILWFTFIVVTNMTPGPIEPLALAWFVALFFHGLYVAHVELTERAIRLHVEREQNAYYREIAEAVLQERDFDKLKRSERLTLNDDGELVDVPAEDESWSRRKRGW
jgi:hypothetical protein